MFLLEERDHFAAFTDQIMIENLLKSSLYILLNFRALGSNWPTYVLCDGNLDQLECAAPEILFTLPSPNPYPTCVLTNLNFQCPVVQRLDSHFSAWL